MKALLYGVIGGVLSVIILMILGIIFRAEDSVGAILSGTVLISVVICSCTGIIVDKLNK